MGSTDLDIGHLRRAIALASEAAARGEQPFGALLIGSDGKVLAQATGSVHSTNDPTGHAELNVLRIAGPRHGLQALAGATLYASAEPCAMCAAGIYLARLRRLVYGASTDEIRKFLPSRYHGPPIRSREILAAGGPGFEVFGPTLHKEALRPFVATYGLP